MFHYINYIEHRLVWLCVYCCAIGLRHGHEYANAEAKQAIANYKQTFTK
jgi:hypothetical protein